MVTDDAAQQVKFRNRGFRSKPSQERSVGGSRWARAWGVVTRRRFLRFLYDFCGMYTLTSARYTGLRTQSVWRLYLAGRHAHSYGVSAGLARYRYEQGLRVVRLSLRLRRAGAAASRRRRVRSRTHSLALAHEKLVGSALGRGAREARGCAAVHCGHYRYITWYTNEMRRRLHLLRRAYLRGQPCERRHSKAGIGAAILVQGPRWVRALCAGTSVCVRGRDYVCGELLLGSQAGAMATIGARRWEGMLRWGRSGTGRRGSKRAGARKERESKCIYHTYVSHAQRRT